MASTTYSAIARARGVVWCATLLILVSAMALCCKRREESVGHVLLHRADSALIADADTLALGILTAMEDSIVDALSEEDRALYAVLVNQALDRNDYAVDDSLAQAAAYYYLNNNVGDDYHEGLAYYYMGHSEDVNNIITSFKWFEKAKHEFEACGNLKYDFLSTFYYSYASHQLLDINICLSSYSEALCLAKKIGNNWYVSRSFAGMAMCFSHIGDIDSTRAFADSAFSCVSNNSTRSNIYNSLCRVYKNNRDYKYALLYCDSAKNIFPEDTTIATIQEIESLIGLKRYNEALTKAKKISPDDDVLRATACGLLSSIYLGLNNQDSSLYYNAQHDSLQDRIYAQDIAAMKNAIAEKEIDDNNSYVMIATMIALFVFVILLSYSTWKMYIKKKTNSIQYVNSFAEIRSKLYIALSNVQYTDSDCRTIALNSINQSIPCAIENMLKKCPSLNMDDALCVICYWAELSTSETSRIVALSRGGTYKRTQRALEKIKKACENISDDKMKEYLLGV